MDSFLNQVLPGLVSNIVGGVALTAFFFFLKERVFRISDVTDLPPLPVPMQIPEVQGLQD